MVRTRYLAFCSVSCTAHPASLKKMCCEICAANLGNRGFDADVGLPFGLDRDELCWEMFPAGSGAGGRLAVRGLLAAYHSCTL